MDVSEREYFRYLRDHPAPAPFIGPPVRSKVNGAWTIAIARRVSGAGGEFLGIVASYVEARYFEDFYQAINTNKGESIGLFRHDGTVLARYPHIEKMIGEKISTKSPWYENVASGGGLGYGVDIQTSDNPVTPAWSRSVFNGLAQVMVQSTKEAGEIKL